MKKSFGASVGSFAKRNVILIILFLMIIFFQFRNPNFLSIDNIITILRQSACTGILAVGLGIVLIVGGIDLSVGAQVTLTTILLSMLTVEQGWPIWAAALICIAVATAIGFVSGTSIFLTAMPPLIATLGMSNIIQGAAYLAHDGLPVYGIPEFIRLLGQGSLWIIPIPVLIWMAVLALGWFLLAKTKVGRNIFAVGSNEEAARLSGINTFRIKVFCYSICGLFAGVSGIVMTGRLNSGQTNAGGTLYIDALSACVIGGISMSGGEGKLPGTIIGIVIMTALANGMIAIGLNSYVQLALKGLIMMAVVGFDTYQRIKKVASV